MANLRNTLKRAGAGGLESPGVREKVVEFLQKFRFISPGEAQREDGPVTGIRRFQIFHDLEETGRLDAGTREAFMWARCGNFKFEEGLIAKGRSRSELYERENLCRWDFNGESRELIFAFDSNVDLVRDSLLCDQVRDAIRAWTPYCGITFGETRAALVADIAIDWRPANDPDFSLLGSDAIAHADYPGECGEVVSGPPKPVHFDYEEHEWSPSHFNIWNVALHEAGHILGLRHSNDPSSVMYHSFKEAEPSRTFSAIDIEILRSLYP